MPTLIVTHRTQYRYAAPVRLGPHRLMLRPRESASVSVLSASLTITPPARLTTSQDVHGNSVVEAVFESVADHLAIESVVSVDLDAVAWPVFAIAPSAQTHPFAYSSDDAADLGALAQPQHADPDGRLADWARGFVLGARTDTLSLLKDINEGIHGAIAYRLREAEGVQAPLETLALGAGSCRDLATLMAEAARRLGFGARLVSGYLHDPVGERTGSAGAGSTHAWLEIYLPGSGWIAFDPTNRSLGGVNLIPVAVCRDLRLAPPVAGGYVGPDGALIDLEVSVDVRDAGDAAEARRAIGED